MFLEDKEVRLKSFIEYPKQSKVIRVFSSMILFYSVHCKHCQMLMDSIKRFDVDKIVKLIHIQDLQRTHPSVFQQIKMVPALMLLPSKEIIYGKAVFDYLLLPSRGKLVTPRTTQSFQSSSTQPQNLSVSKGILYQEEGVMAFNSAKGMLGDSFADINEPMSTPESATTNPHGAYNWTSIEEMVTQGSVKNEPIQMTTYSPMVGRSGQPQSPPFEVGVETRNTKQEYDLDRFRIQREQEEKDLFGAQTRPV